MKAPDLFLIACLLPLVALAQTTAPLLFPADGATGVAADAPLKITFAGAPVVGRTGLIRIVDETDGRVVDTLDLAIPSSPNPSGRPPPPGTPPPVLTGPDGKPRFQSTRIGSRDFHFHPIIVGDNVATIYRHQRTLAYGRRYSVKIDAGVLGGAGSAAREISWSFTTRAAPPPADAVRVVVAADGSGDFATVQGAIDFVPDNPPRRVTIFIRNGRYEEIVSFANKRNLTIRGEDRDRVQVGYANNSAFNPGRRWAFSMIDVADIQLSRFTIDNHAIGQAEALMTRGERIVIDHMTLNGSGDAFTPYGTVYFADSKLTGHGDTVLGYAAVYFVRSEIHSIGPFTWTRTPEGSRGNVFVDCTFIGLDVPLPWTVTAADPAGRRTKAVFARLPRNTAVTATASNYPHAEMVLINARTQGIAPEGWGPVEEAPAFDSSQVRFWEYNTMDLQGRPIDLSRRHPVARQLTMEKDAETIAKYRRPEFVLGGWTPVVHQP